ncbi:hypothetical protein [Chitinivorax sp. B]|uniref:hypothetical protein n=1 Tax=Chitinivorax sp. B TaxID=2502235 RepID=UPI0010F554CE|nr:hypothetical protein [Chitinivorax sp. B]
MNEWQTSLPGLLEAAMYNRSAAVNLSNQFELRLAQADTCWLFALLILGGNRQHDLLSTILTRRWQAPEHFHSILPGVGRNDDLLLICRLPLTQLLIPHLQDQLQIMQRLIA